MVDNGSDVAAELIVHQRERDFLARGLALLYIRNSENSLATARNVGIRLSSGEIVVFLDDDVVVDPGYIREIVKVYETRPEALGVQGYIVCEHSRSVRDFFHRLFFWYHLELDRCRVLPSVSATYPLMLQKVIPCQWLSGANHSYRRRLLEEFKYDEQLIKYSDGEDLELSLRVFKRYPGSLFITPSARLTHNASVQGRALGKELVYMREVYGLYLFFKLFNPTLKNTLIYLWSRVGRLMFTLARTVVRGQIGGLAELCYLLGAYLLCLWHIGEVKRGDLDFFNNSLM